MLALLGVLMFAMKISFAVPEWAESSSVALRWHNGVVKKLIRGQLEVQLRKRIDRHFVFSAHSRYKFAPRKPKYLSWKIKNRGRDVKATGVTGSGKNGGYQTSYGVAKLAPDANLDLIKTGRTRREIHNGATITVGGSGNLIRGRLTLRVPIPGGSGREMDFAAKLRLAQSPRGRKRLASQTAKARMDTVKRTISEIEAFAPDEIREINQALAEGYAAALNTRRTVRKK